MGGAGVGPVLSPPPDSLMGRASDRAEPGLVRGLTCGQAPGKWAEPDPLGPTGFEGTLCERNVDDCSPDPCHHGRCVDGIASFSCACAPGYTGTRCESQVDECRSQPCRHGGKCLDLVDKYLCRCPSGTTGGTGGWGRNSTPGGAQRVWEWCI